MKYNMQQIQNNIDYAYECERDIIGSGNALSYPEQEIAMAVITNFAVRLKHILQESDNVGSR